ncbi:condensation domain-containing protein, partial [Lysinibacillus sphaericus]|uniref:condensation domain-containing protein n=1 Tax=Lysinibacillus sphaericus TaxID=1421 RepID=UPI0018CCDDCA
LEGTAAEGAGLVSTVAKFDLTFNVEEHEGQYGVMLEYCTALFKEETVKQILKHYEEVLRQVVERQDCLLGQVEMVTEDEKEKILHDFNATKTEYPREKTVVELFEEQAAKTPDQIALVFEEEEVSYRELNERANVLAHK